MADVTRRGLLAAGSVAGMSRSQIAVIIDGVPQRVADREDGSLGGGGDLLELQQQWSRYYADMIRDQLSDGCPRFLRHAALDVVYIDAQPCEI